MPVTAQEFWATHEADWDGYWAGREQPHRQVLMASCQALSPFQSVLEIGCGAGTNLALLSDAFPWITVEGSDMSESAVAFAQEHLPKATIRHTEALEDLRWRESQSVDLVLACYTLAYVDLSSAVSVVTEMIRVARRAVMIVEPHSLGASLMWRTIRTDPEGPVCAEWMHDYFEMVKWGLKFCHRGAKLSLAKIMPQSEACNAMTVVEFL